MSVTPQSECRSLHAIVARMHKSFAAALAAAVLLLAAPESASAQTDAIDLLIKNARIVDGTGAPAYQGDIAVRGDTILRIAPRIDGAATKVVDARGQVIAPGFIDIHVHARDSIFQVPTAENYVRQGVTTLIEGPDGSSPVPLKPFFEKLATLPRSVNIGSFSGQGAVRAAVIGNANRKPTAEELERMRALVEQGMKD